MKRVFVETNFLIELLRPLPSSGAVELFSRAQKDVVLYLPWVSVPETKRTLERIVKEDLGLADRINKFRIKLLREGTLQKADQKPYERLEDLLKEHQYEALKSLNTSVDAAVTKMTIIEPSKAVIQKTMQLFPVKRLPPFDEMVLGAVLTEAANLYVAGERELFFCNANTKDFSPKESRALEAEYGKVGLSYLSDFNVA